MSATQPERDALEARMLDHAEEARAADMPGLASILEGYAAEVDQLAAERAEMREALQEIVRDEEHREDCRWAKTMHAEQGEMAEECDCFIGRARAVLARAAPEKTP